LLTDSDTGAAAALEAALAQVAEDSFFAMIEPVSPDWREHWTDGTEWMEAGVEFHGATGGRLVCRLPRTLARDLSSAFLGIPEEDLEPGSVEDMVGELTNMICGCWLTRAYRHDLFDLCHPGVSPADGPPPDNWMVVLMNGAPFGVSVAPAGN
jgi:CheY-specific phosphatase CheX